MGADNIYELIVDRAKQFIAVIFLTEMPPEFTVGDDVKELVNEIILKKHIKDISHIKYEAGSQAGDGYVSKTVAVDIINGHGSFRMFLKCALNIKSTDAVPIDKLYENEIYFYDVVFPAYSTFLKERGIQDDFLSVPKCYGTSIVHKILALENLKDQGFILHDRRTVMDDTIIEFVLRKFAKFHAVSFAYKEQENEKYQKLVEGANDDFFCKMMQLEEVSKVMVDATTNFLDKLDPIEDKHILEKCDQIGQKLHFSLGSPTRCLNEYSILTQGDCWCNNMMFLYDNEDPGKPIDIRLIDWQVLRPASPVFDIAYFFYTIASEKALSNLHRHLKIYHEELSSNIKTLGSDPERLYPLHIFEKEWKQHALYGFSMAAMLIRYMLSSKDEVVSMEGIDFDNMDEMEKMYPKLKNEDEYVRRMTILIRHIIKHGYL